MSVKLKKTETKTAENIARHPDGTPKTGHAETDYLLSSPANAKALRESIKQAESGDVVEMKIDFSNED